MNLRERLDNVLGGLSEKRLAEVLDFAAFLAWLDEQQERGEWSQFALAQLARAYGDDEPEYTSAKWKSGSQT